MGITRAMVGSFFSYLRSKSIIMGPKRARPRFQGDATKVAALLSPYATTPDFLRYSTSLKARLDRKRLSAMGMVFAELYSMKALELTQAMPLDIMYKVEETQRASWTRVLAKDAKKEWATDLAKQLRAMCKHVRDALGNGRAWAKQLVSAEAGDEEAQNEGADEEDPEEVQSEGAEKGDPEEAQHEGAEEEDHESDHCTEAEAADEGGDDDDDNCEQSTGGVIKKPAGHGLEDFVVGYDAEHKMAWRASGGSQKEYAMGLQAPANKDGHPVATWADGSTTIIKAITGKEMDMERVLAENNRGRLWQSHNGLWSIQFRKDRKGILVLYKHALGGAGGKKSKQGWQKC